MTVRSRLLVSLGLGLFLSLPGSAVVFNLTPGLAHLVAPLFCDANFTINPSGHRRSHEYLCGGEDQTFLVSAATWLLLALSLSALVFLVLEVRRLRKS
jgi:hypothetical protein